MILFEAMLPFPPTVNTYWRRSGRRVFLSDKAQEFRSAVLAQLASVKRVPLKCDVHCSIGYVRPDKRKRDLDNLQKGLLDALSHAGVISDDSIIHSLHVYWLPGIVKGGSSWIRLLPVANIQSKFEKLGLLPRGQLH